MSNLVGKNILIVDEVDDTRTTLEYAVRELQKDVETAAQKQGKGDKTRFSIFVLHVSEKFLRYQISSKSDKDGFSDFLDFLEQRQAKERPPASRYGG